MSKSELHQAILGAFLTLFWAPGIFPEAPLGVTQPPVDHNQVSIIFGMLCLFFRRFFVSLCYGNYRNIFILSESGEKDGREKYMTLPCISPCPCPIFQPEKLGILGAFLRAQWKSILGLFRALAPARLIRRLPRITQNTPRSLSDAPRIFA